MQYPGDDVLKSTANLAAYQAAAGVDHRQVMQDQRIQSAIWALTEARRVRGDVELMADVRAWLIAKRQELMLILDDLEG